MSTLQTYRMESGDPAGRMLHPTIITYHMTREQYSGWVDALTIRDKSGRITYRPTDAGIRAELSKSLRGTVERIAVR